MTSRMDATIQGAFEVPEVFGDATTQLVLASVPMLRRAANRIVRQSADADDLVQETILRALRARHRFVAGTSIRAWLTTILRRVFLTAKRTERHRATMTNTDSDDALSLACDRRTVANPAGGDPAEYAARVLDHVDDDVKRAFERLPGRDREILVLVVRDGLTYPEIAARLHIPVGTVMSRMYRVRLRIQATVAARRCA